MKRFSKVTDGLFRGGAPSIADVDALYHKFGIRKIVSLDPDVAKRIDRVCKLLGIDHITIPIDMKSMEPIAQLLSYNLKDLLIKGGPTFVHCREGKDRTGMVVAMFECQYMGKTCNEAIAEAKSMGFGLGLNPKVTKFYEKIICHSCNEKHDHANLKHIDNNSADIVDNNRDEAEVILDNVSMKSFAPYSDTMSSFPYLAKNDQYPTRENVDLKQDLKEDPSTGNNVPLVGLYDNDAGIKGVGPVDNGGGFTST